jgi:hypothetical protein
MTAIFSSVFRVLRFPRQGKIVTIDQIVFCILDLGSNVGSKVPFVGDSQHFYMIVGEGMFKDSSLMGTFPLPPPSHAASVAAINMISSFSSEFLGFVNPWVVPRPKDIESYGASMPPMGVDILSLVISSTSIDTGPHLHPNMDCDQPTPPIQVVDSLISHDVLDIDFPLYEVILDVLASIYDPKDRIMYRSYFIYSEPTRVSMMSFHPRLG